ncbi:PH domain-containing protein [Actinoplanes regularis]|uniref:PH domain-containing protein n=1 Tax=Actinoplanes regularis TaxID=52697 RepID=A0A239AYW3_9ACTN|nr:PH domain-containing protein [Actinoplanes regularis]GIE87258.1 hypothetical protein Are01nite_37380 [Actinoplanes regularis]SNS00926.1 PH domain-containing protein [Actinoplanes regularis]
MQWRVKPVLPVTKLMGAVALIVLTVAFSSGDSIRWALAALVGCGLVVWALRDLLVPVRLAADADGITVVTGFAGRRRLRWSDVESVRVEQTVRRGLRSEYLEIDTGDAIYLFSAHELGALPEDVVTELSDLRV